MNIVEYIGENIEHFSFKYFGIMICLQDGILKH